MAEPQTTTGYTFRFTPAQWRHMLDDPGFLQSPDNAYLPPRRLMGLPVEIVPDPRLVWTSKAFGRG